jgi:2-hydroxy-3-keto-5-methylthiopentenyl-1-phosphate phosphatase
MTAKSSLVLVLDFDGTVTRKDIGDEICERFADAQWREIDEKWVRGELTLHEAQRQMWALARAERAEAIAYARQVGALRPGLDALMEGVRDRGGELWLASGGFDFYIEALLGERLARFGRAYFNTTRFADGRIAVDFPHADLHCDHVAVCKGLICDRARQQAERVIFAGDGASDRCAIGHADTLFAVAGGLLARHCAERAIPFVAFDSFDQVLAQI